MKQSDSQEPSPAGAAPSSTSVTKVQAKASPSHLQQHLQAALSTLQASHSSRLAALKRQQLVKVAEAERDVLDQFSIQVERMRDDMEREYKREGMVREHRFSNELEKEKMEITRIGNLSNRDRPASLPTDEDTAFYVQQLEHIQKQRLA